jgi:hypothetical protein
MHDMTRGATCHLSAQDEMDSAADPCIPQNAFVVVEFIGQLLVPDFDY